MLINRINFITMKKNYTIQTNIEENEISLTIHSIYGSTFQYYEIDEDLNLLIDDNKNFKLRCQCLNTSMKKMKNLLEKTFEDAYISCFDICIDRGVKELI